MQRRSAAMPITLAAEAACCFPAGLNGPGPGAQGRFLRRGIVPCDVEGADKGSARGLRSAGRPASPGPVLICIIPRLLPRKPTTDQRRSVNGRRRKTRRTSKAGGLVYSRVVAVLNTIRINDDRSDKLTSGYRRRRFILTPRAERRRSPRLAWSLPP
jgi:hypothetical protein